MNKQKLIYIIVVSSIVLSGLYFLMNSGKGNLIPGKIADILADKKADPFNNLEKIEINKLYGSLYGSGGGHELDKKIVFLKSVGELGKSSFISSFIGDYSGAINDREKFCVSEKQNQDFCLKKQINIKFGKITDTHGNALSGVKLSLDGKNLGDAKSIKQMDGYNNFVHRIRVSKKGYLDYHSKIVLGNSPYTDLEDSPQLLQSDYLKTIKSDEGLTYKTKNFTYTISPHSFINQDGSNVTGNIDVYFFDINTNNGDLNTLNLDVFDGNYNYVGSSMTTLGMPLIKAYSGDKELNIVLDTISGTGKLQNLERAPGINLNTVPKNTWLTKEELDAYKIPPFWFLDQKNGVWKASKMKILDSLGNYEFTL